jgi:glutamyl-tRNA reductase
VEANVGQLDNIELRNLDDLRDWARKGVEQREGEAAKVRVIISEELERYTIDSTARQAAPLIAALHETAE